MTATSTTEIFARILPGTDTAGIFTVEGHAVTRLLLVPIADTVYPVGSSVSCRHEHVGGIVLTRYDANRLGIEIED
jgi:hypothetical protein